MNKVDKEVMELTNNVLRATADGKGSTEYLSDMHKKWWQVAEKCQKSVRIYVNDKYSIDLKEFGCIGHPHNGFKQFFDNDGFLANWNRTFINQEQLNKLSTAGYFAPEKGKDGNRKYSKYRVIVSDVPMINEDSSVTIMKVITTCAPNLMGTSGFDDSEFVDKSGKVKVEAYKKACDEIASLVTLAAKDNAINPLKISEFGLGVYLSKLSDGEKIVAKGIMYKAFAQAAEKNQVHVNWLIWSKIRGADTLVDNLNTNHFNNNNFISAEPGDLIKDVNTWKSKNQNVGELNNGSDRTIGGHITGINPTTTEEQLAQASLLVFVQTKSNPYFLDNVKSVNIENSTMSPMQSAKSNSNTPQISNTNQPNLLDGIREAKRTDNKVEYSCSSKEQADLIANELKKNGINASRFESRGHERVLFEGQYKEQANKVLQAPQQPAITSVNVVNSTMSPIQSAKPNSNTPQIPNTNQPNLLDGIREAKRTDNKVEYSCSSKEQADLIANELKKNGINASRFESRGHERVLFDGQYKEQANKVLQAPQQPTIQPVMKYSPPVSSSTTNTNAPKQETDNLDEIRLFTEGRVTRQQVPCYEITCKNPNQIRRIVYAIEQGSAQVSIIEQMEMNGVHRVKLNKTPESLQFAKDLIASMNKPIPTKPVIQNNSRSTTLFGFFVPSNSEEVRLTVDASLKTRKGEPCYEISCKTENQGQINRITYVIDALGDPNVRIIEHERQNEIYKFKLAQTPEALKFAQDLVKDLNDPGSEVNARFQKNY